MIDKSSLSLKAALSQIKDGSTIMIGGFGTAGQPAELIDGLIELGIKDLVIVNNNAGNGDYGLAKLLKTGAVRKIICSFRASQTHGSLTSCTVPEKSSWNWCRKETLPAVFRLPVWA